MLVYFYFTAILDTVTLIMLFVLTRKMLSDKVSIFSTIIYALSPAVILGSRMAYHTSPIPFFVLLYTYTLWKWLREEIKYFPILIFSLFMLYNFELENSVFILLTVIIIGFGFYKRSKWLKLIANPKILSFSVIAFLIPMAPILIYDMGHGYVQTVVFGGWIFFKAASSVIGITNAGNGSYYSLFLYVYQFLGKLIFIKSFLFSVIIVCLSVCYLLYSTALSLLRKKDNTYLILSFVLIFPLLGIFANKTPSDAYLPSLFIPLIITVSIFLEKLSVNRLTTIVIFIVLISLGTLNVRDLIVKNYYFGKGISSSIQDRINASKFMINNSTNNSFEIVGLGPGSQFVSYTMNYQYLTWYYGKGSQKKGVVKYLVSESLNGIKIIKK